MAANSAGSREHVLLLPYMISSASRLPDTWGKVDGGAQAPASVGSQHASTHADVALIRNKQPGNAAPSRGESAARAA